MLHAVGMSEPIHLADARAQRPDVSWASLKPERAERVRPLTDGLGVRGLGINLFTLQPGHAGRIHRHRRQEEIYVVLQGRLTVTVEGQSYFADAEEVVRIASAVRRQISNDGPGVCVFLALGVVGEHRRGDAEAFSSWEDMTPRSPRDVPQR
jgi:mannose-6-phosphate isomerase-like protein (cupin superfamily)